MPKDKKRTQLTRLNSAAKRMEANAKGPDGKSSEKYKRAVADHDRASRALEALGITPAELKADAKARNAATLQSEQ